MFEAFDQHLFHYCYGGDPKGALYLLMITATSLGSGWSMLAALPLLFPIRTRRFAVSLLATLTATSIAVWALKAVVGRSRPPFALVSVKALFGHPTDHSFPSGHAAGCFAFATFVAVVCNEAARAKPERSRSFRLLSLFVFALAAVIAYSRVYLGCHFPGDVLAGAALGAGFGFHGGRRYLRSPIAQKIGAPLAPLTQPDPK